MPQFSNYKSVIQGIAMSDIKKDSIELEVFPTEIIPGAVSGGFTSATTTSHFTTMDESGKKRTGKVNTTNKIIAEWKSFNGESKPNYVRKGQQVVLFQIGDTDKWYWSFKARDPEMGTTDHRVHYVPARKQEHTGKLPNDEDSYVQGIDTEKGMVTLLKSSKKLGEPVAVHHYVDTQNGLYVITDDKGVTITKEQGQGNVRTQTKSVMQFSNAVTIDFKNDTIQILTHEGTYIQLQKKDIIIHSQRDIIFNAQRQIVFNSPVTTFNQKEAGAIVMNAANIALNATGSIVLKAAVTGINAVTKITQALVTAGIRCTQLVTGSTGSAYSPVTTNIHNGTAQVPNNSADTDTSGSGDRDMAAFPQVEAAFNEVANLINIISDAHTTGHSAPLGLNTSGITSNASASQCTVIKGK